MSKRYSKSSKGKRRGKVIAMFIAGVLLCTGFVTAIGGITNGFDNMNPTSWFEKQANPDNLIKVDAEDYISSQTLLSGVEIDVKDNGVIKVTGEASQAGSVQIASVQLEPGTYTISGLKDASSTKCALVVKYGNGDVAFAGLESQTFVIAQAETVTVHLNWTEGYDFGKVIGTEVKPVLVSGAEAGSFFK